MVLITILVSFIVMTVMFSGLFYCLFGLFFPKTCIKLEDMIRSFLWSDKPVYPYVDSKYTTMIRTRSLIWMIPVGLLFAIFEHYLLPLIKALESTNSH